MATLSTLSAATGPLTHIQVPLGGSRQPQRLFYGLPEFMDGLVNKLPTWTCGRLNAAQTPQEQMDTILEKWISGREIKYEKMFKDLTPGSDEIWEFKSPDLRIFGWIYRPKVFIAAILGYADDYKRPTIRESYDRQRTRVISMRDQLDLDEPKYTADTFDALV